MKAFLFPCRVEFVERRLLFRTLAVAETYLLIQANRDITAKERAGGGMRRCERCGKQELTTVHLQNVSTVS